MKTPIIPPYTPETGISQTTAAPIERRPKAGRFAADEAQLEARYLKVALPMVRDLWPTHSVDDIAMAVACRTGFKGVTTKLIWGLKARLDTARRRGPE